MDPNDPLDPNARLGLPAPPRGGRTPRRFAWLLLGCAAAIGVLYACVLILRAMGEARMQTTAQEAARSEPGDAKDVLAGLPGSGIIAADVTNVAARTPAPTMPVSPDAKADENGAAPATHTTTAAPQQVDDIALAARRAAWQQHYQDRLDEQKRKRDAIRTNASAGLATAWGAQGRQQQATPPDAGMPGMNGMAGAMPAAAGSPPPTPRPGWFNQGPSNPGNAWLGNGVVPTVARFAAMKGDTIGCTTEKAIGSEIGGQFTAMVTKPLTDGIGRTLIPYGAKLVATYDQNTGQGQSRLPVGFTDVIFPPVGPEGRRDHLSLGSMPGNDADGRAGFSGEVNRHTGRILFAGIISALAGSAGQAASIAAGTGQAAGVAASTVGQVGATGQNIVGRGVNTASTIDVSRPHGCSVELTQNIPFPGQWIDGVGFVP
jgi:type IV secretion system protein TrbI